MSAQALHLPVAAYPLSGLLAPLHRLRESLAIRVGPVRDLEKLSDHLLHDIGVDPRAVRDPARKATDNLYLLGQGFRRL